MLALLTLIVSVSPFSAAENKQTGVLELNIGIRPSHYRKLISDETEPVFTVRIASEDNRVLRRAKIKLRGAASKAMGLASPMKRIPLDLQLDPEEALARRLSNTSVKLINSYTPFRLLGEYAALDLFDYAEVPVSEHELVFLRYNGVDFGLYLAVEELNDAFLAKHFPNGTLYKADPSNYKECDSISSWFGCLRLTAGQDTKKLDALLNALDAGEGYENYLDTDEILRFFACLAIDGADSSFLTEQNNFYLCDTGEKFILLPWDNSEAFEGYETTNGIDHYRMDPWEDTDYPPPLFTLLMAKEDNRERYHEYLRQLNDGFLAPSEIDPYINRLAAAAQPYLQRDVTIFFNDPYELPLTAEELRYGTLSSLFGSFHAIHENIAAQLNGETDLFHMSTALAGVETIFSMYDIQGITEMLLNYSPSVDPEITEKIIAAYPAWCRSMDIIPFDADNPTEIVFCLIVLCTAFLLTVIMIQKGHRRRGLPANKEMKREEAGTE